MTHDDILEEINDEIHDIGFTKYVNPLRFLQALRAVVELHQPDQSGLCEWCTCKDCDHMVSYPCKTIQKIELDL